MGRLKILLASPEAAPFAKTGGLADVAGILPLELKALGCEVKTFLPYYRQVKEQPLKATLLKKSLKVKLGDSDIAFSLYSCKSGKANFYFIKNDRYYDRDFLYGTASGDYPDNAVRFALFANAVLKSAVTMGFRPDVLHLNDWQTGLIPFYLKRGGRYEEFFKKTKTLFTIHNLAYQGLFPREDMPKVGIGYEFFTPDTLEFYGKFSLMKAGILYADAISTVSKGYAREMLTKEFGCGLDGLLRTRSNDLYGIINGVDYSQWDPGVDGFIASQYDKKNLRNKTKCKKDLLSLMKLKVPPEAPLLGVVSRLAEQKGIDIIVESADEMIKLGCNLVILGTGEREIHKLLLMLAHRHPGNVAVKITFDNALAHKIEAGCDMFLMPSRYEPCGLNQMYSLKYGTIPVVRAVGGLDDTIIDYTGNRSAGNGFKFDQASAEDMIGALKRALSVYRNKPEWKKLVARGMGLDFSWKHSAGEYLKVYNKMRAGSSPEACLSSRAEKHLS